jgi:hypothetical protein
VDPGVDPGLLGEVLGWNVDGSFLEQFRRQPGIAVRDHVPVQRVGDDQREIHGRLLRQRRPQLTG